MTLEQVLWVAAGGALGTLLRALITMRFRGLFPWSTLFVNVAGSLLIGALFAWALFGPGLASWQHGFDIGGFCGSFTTFSSFSYQTAVLWREGHKFRAAGYVALSLVLGLLAVVVGFEAGALFFRQD